MATLKVLFNNLDEFLAELGREAQTRRAIVDDAVRLTYRHRQSQTLPIQYVDVVASYAVHLWEENFQIVSLEHPCGDYLPAIAGVAEADPPTLKRAEAALQRIAEAIEQLGLQRRAGSYQSP